jgi:hypothetical protein
MKISWRFGGTYRRHLQVLRVSEGRKSDEAGSEYFVGCLSPDYTVLYLRR